MPSTKNELVELVLDDRGHPLNVVGHPGVGLVMGYEDGGDLGVGVKDAAEIVYLDGGALRKTHLCDIGPEVLGDLAEAVAERTD